MLEMEDYKMKTKKIIAFFIAVGIVFNSITVVNAASQRKVCKDITFGTP